jgi:hypothetical protein
VAGMKDFKKVSGASADVAKLQERLQEFFAQFATNPLLNGVLLIGQQIGTTATRISHGLGRPYQGYIIVDQDASATVWTASSDLKGAYITLQASAPVTASLWVF